MADELRCWNCGNAGRFNVVVTNRRVNGQWCRIACSRLCGEIVARQGCDEMNAQAGPYGTQSTFTISPILSGRSAQTVHLS